MKNILIINSAGRKELLVEELFLELEKEGYKFFQPDFGAICGVKINLVSSIIKFLLLYPWFYCLNLVCLARSFYRHKINTIICFNSNDKIIYTPLARFFNLKVVWLEFPEYDYGLLPGMVLRVYKEQARAAQIITFCNYTKTNLQKLGISDEQITVIQPGIKADNNQYQENIFSSLATKDKSDFRRNFFTIGTFSDFQTEKEIEVMFYALRKALEVAPGLQFIAIGDGPKRKTLSWLAKKLKIENLVWLVGEQKYHRKWLSGFDLFWVSSDRPNLSSFYGVLEAMLVGLPIIGPIHAGLDDIIYENKTGTLVENNNSEMLARQIIKLQQEKDWRLRLGKNGQARVSEYFIFAEMMDKFRKIL